MLSLRWGCAGMFSFKNMVPNMVSRANIWLKGCNITAIDRMPSTGLHGSMIKWPITTLVSIRQAKWSRVSKLIPVSAS